MSTAEEVLAAVRRITLLALALAACQPPSPDSATTQSATHDTDPGQTTAAVTDTADGSSGTTGETEGPGGCHPIEFEAIAGEGFTDVLACIGGDHQHLVVCRTEEQLAGHAGDFCDDGCASPRSCPVTPPPWPQERNRMAIVATSSRPGCVPFFRVEEVRECEDSIEVLIQEDHSGDVCDWLQYELRSYWTAMSDKPVTAVYRSLSPGGHTGGSVLGSPESASKCTARASPGMPPPWSRARARSPART